MQTVWEVLVEDEWRYATPDVAALVAVSRPGNVRLTEMAERFGIRFERLPKHLVERKPVSKLRLLHAERALKRQREKAGLFADHLAASQPTPEQRIRAIDDRSQLGALEDRTHRAAAWRRCRAMLAKMPADARRRILFKWNVASCPAVPEFLSGCLKGSK
jgi:hypothetical protein